MDEEEEHIIDIIEKENDDLLLSLIRDKPCIYDKSSSDHKDQVVIDNSWQEIAAIMHDSSKFIHI